MKNTSPSFHGIGFKLKKLTNVPSSHIPSNIDLPSVNSSSLQIKSRHSQIILPSLSPSTVSPRSTNPLNPRSRFGSLPHIFSGSPIQKEKSQILFALKENSYPRAKQIKTDVSINSSSFRLFQDVRSPEPSGIQRTSIKAIKSPEISFTEFSMRKQNQGSFSRYKDLMHLDKLVKEASEETEVSNELTDVKPLYDLQSLKGLSPKGIINKQAMISESAENSTRNHYTKKLKLVKKNQASRQLANLINTKIADLPLNLRNSTDDDQSGHFENLQSIQLPSTSKRITIKDTSSPNTERSFGEDQSVYPRKVPKIVNSGTFKSFLTNNIKTIELNQNIFAKDTSRSVHRDGGLSKDTMYSLMDKQEALGLGSPRRKNLIKFDAGSEEMKCFNNLASNTKKNKKEAASLYQIIRKKKDQTKKHNGQMETFKQLCKGVIKPEEYFGAQDRSLDNKDMFFVTTDRDTEAM